MEQIDLFEAARGLPQGFRCQPDLITTDEESCLLESLRHLVFKEFHFRGSVGKRRVASFGWRYDFEGAGLTKAEPVPALLLALGRQAASFAGTEPEALEHVLVTDYPVGAAIGWHKDRAVFGDVIGISSLAPSMFRLRRRTATGWERASLVLEPRSAYLLSGPARALWEHSIPPVERPRYPITFRSMRRRHGT